MEDSALACVGVSALACAEVRPPTAAVLSAEMLVAEKAEMLPVLIAATWAEDNELTTETLNDEIAEALNV